MVHRRGWVDEGDQVLPLVHHIDLMLAKLLVKEWLLDLDDDLRTAVDLLRSLYQLSTSCLIVLVVICCAFASSTLK